MELIDRKRINNGLPKFDGGKNYWQDMGNPLGDGWYHNNSLQYGDWVNPNNVPPYLNNLNLLKGLSSNYNPSDPRIFTNNITTPLSSLDPNTSYNLERISNIKTSGNQNVKVNPNSGLKAASVVGGAANIVGGYIEQQSAVKSSDELLANAGTSLGNVMGILYQRQNDVDSDREMDALTMSGISNTLGSVATGASAGAAFGPIGAVVGGAVGGIAGLIGLGTSKHKLRKRIENARIMALRRNTYNMSNAMTTGLQQDYYSNNTSGGILYANNGKDLKQPIYENR